MKNFHNKFNLKILFRFKRSILIFIIRLSSFFNSMIPSSVLNKPSSCINNAGNVHYPPPINTGMKRNWNVVTGAHLWLIPELYV
jgi:hypothetical protein